MKTIVYVDGYNLFYGLLKHTPYKWLDLHTLFQGILKVQNPNTDLLCVKYYTADIKAKFASQGQEAVTAQSRYHKALESPHTGSVEVIKGYYSESKSTPMRYRKPPDKTDRVEAWKLEEKQTDVNLALDVYRDASRSHCDQVVICTSDTDIAPALSYVRNDCPSVTIGAVLPRPSRDKNRPIAKGIDDLTCWTRRHITEAELEKAQFSNRVPTTKKPVDKPGYW